MPQYLLNLTNLSDDTNVTMVRAFGVREIWI